MPFLQSGMGGRQLVMPGIKEISEHSQQIEIDETGAVIQQEGGRLQHLLERNQPLGEFTEQMVFLFEPLLETPTAKFSFFEPKVIQAFGGWNEFLEVRIIEFERAFLDIVFHVTPEDILHAGPLSGEKIEVELIIKIFGDDLRMGVGFEQDVPAVLDDRDLIVPVPGQAPHQRPFIRGET